MEIKLVKYNGSSSSVRVHESKDLYVSFGGACNYISGVGEVDRMPIAQIHMFSLDIDITVGGKLYEEVKAIVDAKETPPDTICPKTDRRLLKFAFRMMGLAFAKRPNLFTELINQAKEQGRQEGKEEIQNSFRELVGIY